MATGRVESGSAQAQSAPGDENTPATGEPGISGTPAVGQTLTATTSQIEDEDGLSGAVFAYQWLADDTEIEDATGSTYTVASADVGRAIRVRVSFTDDGGNDESRTSGATAVEAGEAVTVSYAKPDGPDFIRDTLGNVAESFSGETANNTADSTTEDTARRWTPRR